MHDMFEWTKLHGQGGTAGNTIYEEILAFGLGKIDVPLKLHSKASLRMSLRWKPSGKSDDT